MAIGPRLDLRQSQSLVMTPQLQQAIKLLQMSNLELTEYVDQELEQNPLLEREDAEGGLESDATGSDEREDAAGASDGAAAAPDDGFGGDPVETPDSAEQANSETLLENDSAALDVEYDNVWDTRSASDGGEGAIENRTNWLTAGPRGAGDDGPDLENVAAEAISLREYLRGQVNVDLDDPIDRMIAGHLIEALDDAGYLTVDLAGVAEIMGCRRNRVAETLERLKRLDPPGIFARDLSECLALQLRDRNRLDGPMQALVNNLDLLAKRDFRALRKSCGVDSEALAEMIRELKALNPKPATAFDHAVTQPVTADVTVRPGADGSWHVELNTDTLPRVLINSRYYAVVSKKARGKSEREYLIDCFHSANWLIKSLQQRAQTILKVAAELVHQQDDFFARGVQHLKPLTLRDIASEIGVHESTVSRVTNNTEIGVSRGVFAMKYFFTSAIGGRAGAESLSAESVRFRIKTLIGEEAPDRILSDDRIVDILGADGIDIARRTVAKYRESMRIPSSVQRRREKTLQL